MKSTSEANFRSSILIRGFVLRVLFIGLCLAIPCMAFAQADQGTITGVVKDSTGAAIPNAQVALTDTDTNLTFKGRSNEDGIFIFSPIKIGDYKVSIAAPGFSTVIQENLHVNVQQRLDVPIMLKPGGVNETVTVNTAPPVLQTQDASLGQVISTETINNTPSRQVLSREMDRGARGQVTSVPMASERNRIISSSMVWTTIRTRKIF
jgi:hypothetical protein